MNDEWAQWEKEIGVTSSRSEEEDYIMDSSGRIVAAPKKNGRDKDKPSSKKSLLRTKLSAKSELSSRSARTDPERQESVAFERPSMPTPYSQLNFGFPNSEQRDGVATPNYVIGRDEGGRYSLQPPHAM